MFETFKDMGPERWEIYAWAVRDAMMKAGGFEACDLTVRQKLQYEAHMQLKPNVEVPIIDKTDATQK